MREHRLGKQSTASPGRERSAAVAVFSDRLGPGRRMTVECRDQDKSLDLRVEVGVYDRRPMVTFETRCTNVSSRDVVVTSLEPLRVVADEGGTLLVPGVSACLTNGEMFYDAGRVHAFAGEPPGSVRPPVKGVRLVNESIARAYPTVASWWNVGLFSGYDREAWCSATSRTRIRSASFSRADGSRRNRVRCVNRSLRPPITLAPGQTIGSNRFMLTSPRLLMQRSSSTRTRSERHRTRGRVRS